MLNLALVFNVLRAPTVPMARVACSVGRARTAKQARVHAATVARASTATPMARLLQAPAATVARASTAHPMARLIQAPAETVARASTAHPFSRLIQAPAGTVARASTAHPLARLIHAPAATVPRASTANSVARLVQATASIAPGARGGVKEARSFARHVRVAKRERPAAGDSSVPAPPATVPLLKRRPPLLPRTTERSLSSLGASRVAEPGLYLLANEDAAPSPLTRHWPRPRSRAGISRDAGG